MMIIADRQTEAYVSDIGAKALKVKKEEITEIAFLKKGMTNRSVSFSYRGRKYIMRIPGEGTEKLIDRKCETEVYRVIEKRNICDDIIYIDPYSGVKISKYIENSKVCDPLNREDVRKCIKKLRDFHAMEFKVEQEFDIFRQIEFYEALRKESAHADYGTTKEAVWTLQEYINANVEKKVLTHIDAVPDNFLFARDKNGQEVIYLIDWEYAAMQDPHVDIAMFAIYALYDKKQIDDLIDIYFEEKCDYKIRIKIYCYISACGLLWSNWCEYKESLGITFGEYSIRQYRYAKEYYEVVCKELGVKNGV